MARHTIAKQAMHIYDRHGEFTMLCWLMSMPATRDNRDRWRDNGLLFLSDGSEISHQGHKYRFGPPGWDVRDSAMRQHFRPLPNIVGEPLEVPVAMYDGADGPCRSKLVEVGIKSSLQVLITGNLPVSEAVLLSPSGDPFHVLGVNLPYEDGDNILKPAAAYHYIQRFTAAIAKNGIGSPAGMFEPQPMDEFGLESWASIFEICNQSLDKAWDIIEPDCLAPEFLFMNARHIWNVVRFTGDLSGGDP